MRLVVKVNDTDYVLTMEQMDALATMLAGCEVRVKEYLGSSVPEAQRWLEQIKPADDLIKADVMDDTRHAALVSVYKMRKDVTK